MKGAVFTEFIEFVEESYSFETADRMLEPEDGLEKIYTQGGNYPTEEFIRLIISVHEVENIEVEDIIYQFGIYLFPKLIRMDPSFIKDSTKTLDVISKVDSYIHIEVKKLYPEADLPKFKANKLEDNYLEIEYISEKRLEILAKGLMMGVAKHFNENIEVEMETLTEEPHTVLFKVRKII